MLPAAFEYHAPKSMDEALGLLDELGEDAKVLAGGQSLIPLLKLRFASPGHLVDINKIKDLDYLEERDGTLRVGALYRHKSAERSSLLASRYQVMADAAPQIADPSGDPVERQEEHHHRALQSLGAGAHGEVGERGLADAAEEAHGDGRQQRALGVALEVDRHVEALSAQLPKEREILGPDPRRGCPAPLPPPAGCRSYC